jgi:predicted transcriptional regulator
LVPKSAISAIIVGGGGGVLKQGFKLRHKIDCESEFFFELKSEAKQSESENRNIFYEANIFWSAGAGVTEFLFGHGVSLTNFYKKNRFFISEKSIYPTILNFSS